jgi:acetyltransferase-like isoleucine patch superfamily enzyme
MSRLARGLGALAKLAPVVGLIDNRVRFPHVHCGRDVEIWRSGRLIAGRGVRIGALTRIYLGPEGVLDLGDNVGLGRDVHVQSDGRVAIGAHTGVSDRARIYGAITIGRHCDIGANFNVASGRHVFRSAEPWRLIQEQDVAFPSAVEPVVLGDDCFVGINVTVMAGLTVGRGAVIGANAVVTRDVPPYAIVAGVPAKVIGERLAFRPPAAIFAATPEHAPYFYSGFGRAGAGAAGHPCDPSVVIALDVARRDGVTLTFASETGGIVRLGAAAERFPPGESAIVLPLDGPGPFLALAVEGRASLLRAEATGAG